MSRLSLDLTTPELNKIVLSTQDQGFDLDDDVAATVASYWHGGQGSAFYAFCSSGHYDRSALLRELSEVISASYDMADEDDRRQLDMLGTYLINRVESSDPWVDVTDRRG